MEQGIMKANSMHLKILMSVMVSSDLIALLTCLSIPESKYILLGLMLIDSLVIYVILKNSETKLNRQLDYLIECSEKIIENRIGHIQIIDGESKLSVLSHKLYLLNERFFKLLEKINQEKVKLKDYIEDISHQIKTPITSMQINEELLLETKLSLSQKQKIENIYDQTQKINQLLEVLLRLAKLEANTIDFDFKDYYLYELIDNVENILTPLLLQNNVKINFNDTKQKLRCDFVWLSEAIENILKNCIEINPNDTIDIYLEDKPSYLKIYFHDHGGGFSQEDLQHLFDRFFSSKNTRGFGIGLALAKEIINAHHGTIEAINDHGALFIITLPKIFAKQKY
ncbi:sensor histidine kinase KdpD [Thomasclavelia sp.]|uniref:sensor histidine kinase n=1 Tax=Thomasclavelia sp. TaxID=3025757 RepID=UPI0025D0EC4C|nr:HAMP domain-containing sensor histidine kinase [Thomasclavelia sp.]